MARGRKAGTINIDQQIEDAQQKVIKAKKAYEQATHELKILLDKRDSKRKEELWEAVAKSEKTYEEILKMIQRGSDAEDE